jgi:hypothetical protein
MRVGDVEAHPLNPKIHPASQLDPLRGLLETVGKLDDLKAYYSERNGGKLTFFDGHGRQSLDPSAEWDIDIYNLTDAEADLVLATFDPIAYQAEQSRVKLEALLNEVSTGSASLQRMLSEMAEKVGIVSPLIEMEDVRLGGDDDSLPVGQEQRILLLVPPEEYEDARRAMLRLTEENRTWDVRFPK